MSQTPPRSSPATADSVRSRHEKKRSPLLSSCRPSSSCLSTLRVRRPLTRGFPRPKKQSTPHPVRRREGPRAPSGGRSRRSREPAERVAWAKRSPKPKGWRRARQARLPSQEPTERRARRAPADARHRCKIPLCVSAPPRLRASALMSSAFCLLTPASLNDHLSGSIKPR
jgi:hypothetical protein